ncbi:MAG: SpoVR family protein [Calditrichaceae bacterium]
MILYGELAKSKMEIEGYAREYNLDFYQVVFELLQYDEISEIAAKGGFPTRYPHWRFGMEYEHLSKGYQYGLQKIYEMVINNDPCYAYLMSSNSLVDQKLVMAHVYAHCDFFKNNYYFSKTNRKMMDEMANHAMRIRKYIDIYGQDDVENFIDRCLSLENLIDYQAPFIKRKSDILTDDLYTGKKVRRLKSKKYMEQYINPPEFIEEQMLDIETDMKKSKKFPEHSERDVLAFLIQFAPLEEWQRDVLDMIREEAYYFGPQGQTKIMNEGWASYWHSKIMTTRVLNDSEIIDYAEHHSGTVQMTPGQLNPYKIGLEIFRDIEERWDKGKFGKEYDECDDYVEKKMWDKKLGLGRQKIFEIRKMYNDVNFIDTFLTEEFCNDHKLFTYEYNERTKRQEISSRNFKKIKEMLLFSLTNAGQPIIEVDDANYNNRTELLLNHVTDSIGLDVDYAQRTLENIQYIWKRPVLIRSKSEDDNEYLLLFDGKEHKTERI